VGQLAVQNSLFVWEFWVVIVLQVLQHFDGHNRTIPHT
jgi:hypothetical protein